MANNPRQNRRTFLLAAAAPLLIPRPALTQGAAPILAPTVPAGEAFPSQDPQLVIETVSAAHGNVARLKELVGARPELAKATIDWGFGDWESALDGASHIGHREIAEFLIAAGARPTIFSAAMLGQLDVVRAFLTASPAVARQRGPHGITLMRHAQAGGAAAQPVVEYLRTVPGTDDRVANLPVSKELGDRLVGAYEIEALGGEPLNVAAQAQSGQLTIARGRRTPRPLMHQGDLEFSPSGAAAVRLRFSIGADRVTLTILEGGRVVGASKRA